MKSSTKVHNICTSEQKSWYQIDRRKRTSNDKGHRTFNEFPFKFLISCCFKLSFMWTKKKILYRYNLIIISLYQSNFEFLELHAASIVNIKLWLWYKSINKRFSQQNIKAKFIGVTVLQICRYFFEIVWTIFFLNFKK